MYVGIDKLLISKDKWHSKSNLKINRYTKEQFSVLYLFAQTAFFKYIYIFI